MRILLSFGFVSDMLSVSFKSRSFQHRPTRAVTAEITQRLNDDETKLSWSVSLKQMLEDLKAEAKKDMSKLSQEDERGTSATRASTKDKKNDKKKRGKKRGKEKKKECESQESSSSSSDHPHLHVEKPKRKIDSDKDWTPLQNRNHS